MTSATPPDPARDGPVRVAVVNDYPVVVAGVRSLLHPHSERVTPVRLEERPDVVLYDAFGAPEGDALRVEDVLAGTGAGRLVVYTWNREGDVVRRAMAAGAHGYVFKGLPAGELVGALEAVARGGRITALGGVRTRPPRGSDWPGRADGLSVREAEIVALITQGLTNQDIAEQTHLSINSVKTYIRTAYRKMGVERRPQAVLWGVRHGFAATGPTPEEDAGAAAAAD